MSAYQLLKSSAVVVAASVMASKYIHLREELARQIKLVALLQRELFLREQRHREETSYYKAEMRAVENNARNEIERKVTEILVRVADERGVRFHEDDSLLDMEHALMNGDRRRLPRSTLGSAQSPRKRNPRPKKSH